MTAYRDIPAGSGFGRDPNPRRPTLIEGDVILQTGSRAQRREMLRQLRRLAKAGVPDASESLAAVQRDQAVRKARNWLVRMAGRRPFVVSVPQGATHAEIAAQWPGADIEVSA